MTTTGARVWRQTDGPRHVSVAAPEDIGAGESWHCRRGAWRTQANIRVSYGFKLKGSARIELRRAFAVGRPGVAGRHGQVGPI